MSLKLVRINHPDQIRERVREFLNKKVSLVLRNSTVVFGKITDTTDKEIIVTNMRLKRTKLSLSDIVELQADIQA